MARLAPTTDSTVRRISSSRDWVSTMMVTSSGMRPSSISLRTKSKSVCEAEGKPFDFLQADLDQQVEDAQLLSALIGSISAWLPSRRSVLIQIGGLLMIGVRPGRSVNLTAGKARYWSLGSATSWSGS
jgi:hypothetical protein